MIERPSKKWQQAVAEEAERIARGSADPDDPHTGWAAQLWPAEPVAAVDRVLAAYEDEVASLAENGAVPPEEGVLAAAERAVTGLNGIDREHGIIETGERELLCEYLYVVPLSHGVDMAGMARRHGFDEGDLAGLWRDW